MTSHQGATAPAEHTTGVQDALYNVVSVLYHALQGGESSMQYLHDAQKSGDQGLVQFFQEVQECQHHLAMRAKEVLAQCLERDNGHESHHNMEASTQGYGMMGSQGQERMSSQSTMGSRSYSTRPEQEAHSEVRGMGQDRAESQGHDREHQEPRR